MNLVDHLELQGSLQPEAPALVEGSGKWVSFGELRRLSEGVAARLVMNGLKPGDRVMVFHPVSISLYAFLLGCFRAGVVVVFADPSGGREFLDQVARRVEPVGFFGSRKGHALRWRSRLLRSIPKAFHPEGWWPRSVEAMRVGGEAEILDVGAEHPALITFTSGSTGLPKGAVRTHGFLLAQHAALSEALQLRSGERDLVTLPVFALANLASGVTSVVADADLGRPGEANARRIRRQCQQWRVTRATGSPAFFEALLRGPGFPELEKIFTGGGPVFSDLVDRLKAARSEMGVTAIYGSTEAEPVAEWTCGGWTEACREQVAGGGGLPVGRPVLEVAILPDRWGESLHALCPEAFSAMKLKLGERGEILVTGPQVLKGYLDGRGDEETKVRVGETIWHRTGDAGWLDERGCLWLVGRCAARMGNRYPLEIEAALREVYPRKRTAAVAWQNQVILVVEGEVDSAMEVRARELGCDRVLSFPELPMDRRHQSKVNYPKLMERLARSLG
ncbi:acyl-CoA synthetase (AMP-forming)/AMP-acid ligase II [Haloferula luteola]|uniref:Acyl-CoA synthetase (AMP-forming)/AMP-acid ligase II n=1 Tax=Haloferula luteola TaxID=595692 RepID=A0A840V1M5_9BACT|nr:AMP-binding protein [Haloferula luteola]MBB5352247.1 acyl-CoA synthetase (AMP-forming)/AMP-acid ligase II [Haloferula luteola]